MQSAVLGLVRAQRWHSPIRQAELTYSLCTGRVGKEPLFTRLSFSSDQPCPRPEDLLWGLSSAVQRCEDGGGLRGREALPADGLEQAHSGECRLHAALCSLPVSVESTLSCSPWRQDLPLVVLRLPLPSHRHFVSCHSGSPDSICSPSLVPLRLTTGRA